MNVALSTIFQWIVAYRYGILLPIAILEGPIVSVIAGFLVSLGQMEFWLTYGILILGDILGDLGLYALGRWGRASLVTRYESFFGATPERIEKFEKFFEKHAKKTLLFGKWGHALGFPILLAAGMAKQPIEEFLAVNVAGTIPKTLFFLLLGFYFGAAYGMINKYITDAVIGMIILTAVAGFAYWIAIRITKKYFNDL